MLSAEMPLSSTEVQLLEQACANRGNHAAAALLNVFGASTAREVLDQISAAPVTVRAEFMDQVHKAIEEQRRFRPGR
jgi:hypothetical protein